MIQGLDVSEYQGWIDWEQVASHFHAQERRPFAAVKATEGTWYSDPYFPHNWTEMRRFGFFRMAYHFFRPGADPIAQADHLHGWVRANGRFVQGDMVALDFEVTDGVNAAECLRRAQVFVQRCHEQIAKPVVIYTYPDFWYTTMGNPREAVLSKCPLWMASLGADPPRPPNWPVISFWQYSWTGSVPGIAGHVDLDMFFGNDAQLKKVAGL